MNRFTKGSRLRQQHVQDQSGWFASIGENLIVGIAWGLAMALIFSLLILGLAVLRGSTRYEQYGTTTWGIIESYFGAGVLGGSVYGLLRPLAAAGRLGATVVGVLVGPFVYGAVAVAMDGPRAFFSFEAIVPGVLVGGIVGWQISKPGAVA